MNDTFKWTDELVKEYAQHYHCEKNRHPAGIDLHTWKQSKQQSEKDWEIVAVSNKAFQDSLRYLHPKTEPFNPKTEEIKSVRRKSDGEIFNIDDIAYIKNIGAHVIKEFSFADTNELCARFYDFGLVGLKNISRKKQLLYITYDGKNVFEKDTFPVYKVDKDSFDILQFAACDCANWDGYKYFADKAKAAEYVRDNKPIFSLNDIKRGIKGGCMNTFSNDSEQWYFHVSPNQLLRYFNNTSKEKLNQ